MGLFVHTCFNAFGECMGSHGRLFLREIDGVMGALLGIPHYSKLEACVFTIGVIGCSLSGNHDP